MREDPTRNPGRRPQAPSQPSQPGLRNPAYEPVEEEEEEEEESGQRREQEEDDEVTPMRRAYDPDR